ncbi:MAG: CHAT domain-containing protein [Bacteroidales bacterium]|nr:CHAT domain-containing protein [Bacteroidales bacterium]
MKKISLLINIIFSSVFTNYTVGQPENIDSLFERFAILYNAGDLVNAEETLFLVLKSEETLKEPQLVAVYNNLGVVNLMLGKYDKAIEYNNKAESLVSNNKQNSKDLADIYNNKGYLYYIKKSFNLAIEYLEKSIRIYRNLINKDEIVLINLSSAYINIGIAFLETKDYSSALDYFNKSAEIKSKHNLPGLALVYLNIAKTYVKTNDPVQAEKFYLRSIHRFTDEFGENYFRLAEVYFDYGLFLRSEGRNSEALESHRKALSICLKNYGEKHTLVALSYKHLGDHYFNQADYKTALEYYQESLIAVVNYFNNHDIYSNPSIDSSLFDIRLLDNLKSKARALELFAGDHNDKDIKLKIINTSLGTVELALQLIDRIRNNYLTEESRIYLAENEKETYLFAIHIASALYTLTGDRSMGEKMYSIAQKAKAAVLRNEITESELLYSAAIPDSLREKQNRLSGNISAYNNLILEESRKTSLDSNKISLWKDALFGMNRDKEKVTDEINKEFPQYHDLLQKTEPVPLSEIQKHLHSDETVIDYLLSNQYKNGKRDLYVFLITRDNLEFHETGLDSLFLENTEIIRKADNQYLNSEFSAYTGALSYMYVNLIKPVEGSFAGDRLIIIPDEEIAWLPFDAFLANSPGPEQTDYEGLRYLINNYTISYGYSSSLIFSKSPGFKRGVKVFAFAPDYGNNKTFSMAPELLYGAGKEIESIYKWFRGRKFTGDQGTETNFIQAARNPAMFHLAMHSVSDSINSKYSYLLFDTHSDTIEDGKLYNYEISLTRINSPMVVLSACNSGTGTLNHGEGLMSLARGFILAGASSVVRTAWEVNDETSAEIISRFYKHLSEGRLKDEAMRLAKLDYLDASHPAYSSPYFWAAYEVMGDNAPVAPNNSVLVLIISISLIVAAGILTFYLRRRRIFSDRSL